MLRANGLTVPHVVHGFFTRQGGVSAGVYASLNCGPGSDDLPQHVAENRRLAMDLLGMSESMLCTVHQVHGATVCERFCEARRRSASPPSTEIVASCVTPRPWLYSSLRVPIAVYISFVTNAMRPPGM